MNTDFPYTHILTTEANVLGTTCPAGTLLTISDVRPTSDEARTSVSASWAKDTFKFPYQFNHYRDQRHLDRGYIFLRMEDDERDQFTHIVILTDGAHGTDCPAGMVLPIDETRRHVDGLLTVRTEPSGDSCGYYFSIQPDGTPEMDTGGYKAVCLS